MQKQLLDQLAEIPTSVLGDCLDRIYGISGLQRLDSGGPVAGIALTVKSRCDDNLATYKALTIAKPGDIIVVDAGGSTTHAMVGEIATAYAKKRGVKGWVIDGAVRDSDELSRETDFATFTKATANRGPYKNGPGAVNVPVSICNQVVMPGDIIVGDADGLINFSQDKAQWLLDAARERLNMEKSLLETIANNDAEDQPWLKKALDNAGDTIR
ncbi:MAG: hypothetical protein OIF34_14065 [Porticoccaceae bacterium]|nr:hypothetical protein [Porticoccaceae bacterium]